jgi:hypothetical protein
MCEAGKSQSKSGQATCNDCTAGSYSGSAGAASCEKCPDDTSLLWQVNIYVRRVLQE